MWMLMCLPLGLWAQGAWQPGELVLVEGDTLRGMVAKAKGNQFAYKVDRKGERNFFKEEEVVGYTLGDQQFERHVVDVFMGKFPERREVYLEILVDGPVKLFEYTGTGMLGASHTNRFLFHADASMPWRVPPKEGAFRKQVSMYFGDCESITDRIKSKELGYEQLNGIVVLYNSWAIAEAQKEASNIEETPE